MRNVDYFTPNQISTQWSIALVFSNLRDQNYWHQIKICCINCINCSLSIKHSSHAQKPGAVGSNFGQAYWQMVWLPWPHHCCILFSFYVHYSILIIPKYTYTGHCPVYTDIWPTSQLKPQGLMIPLSSAAGSSTTNNVAGVGYCMAGVSVTRVVSWSLFVLFGVIHG